MENYKQNWTCLLVLREHSICLDLLVWFNSMNWTLTFSSEVDSERRAQSRLSSIYFIKSVLDNNVNKSHLSSGQLLFHLKVVHGLEWKILEKHSSFFNVVQAGKHFALIFFLIELVPSHNIAHFPSLTPSRNQTFSDSLPWKITIYKTNY